MEVKDFLAQMVEVEENIFSRIPSYNKRRGLQNALREAVATGSLSKETASEVASLWQERNKIVSAPTGIAISTDTNDRLNKLRTSLQLP